MMKRKVTTSLLALCLMLGYTFKVRGENIIVLSPNSKIEISLHENAGKSGTWSLVVNYNGKEKTTTVFSGITLGLVRDDQAFTNSLKLLRTDKPIHIKEAYRALHGKRADCKNEATETTIQFANEKGAKMNVVLRAYNDGIAFRYLFPEKKEGRYIMKDEITEFTVPRESERWLQSFTTSYEDFFPNQKGHIKTGEWGYPGLFKSGDGNCWSLVSEAGIDRNYCATKLSNKGNSRGYKLVYPATTDGNSTGSVNPEITLPWTSPWRVAIIGGLADIVESTLVDDVSPPTKLTDTDWIRPGTASWVYWAYNHGTKDFKKLCEYIDLAARMGWPYTLIDWEWDEMENGGKLEDAVKYANRKGVKPVLWYNSGGEHNKVTPGPRNRLTTTESRAKEFTWLKEIGIYGVKVDFFESDKQDMMNYYIDILEDAAKYKLLVNFHGSTVPRGWTRTYPHLMSMEAVYGGEQYNNQPFMTSKGPEHNSTLPYTRNVIGPMDYTPVAFTNSQHTHTTTFAHELALSVIFESGIQHFADRPSAFDALPDAPKEFLRHVPAAWDDTKFIAGYPGRQIVLARRSAESWYVAGINGENSEGNVKIDLGFLPNDKKYRLTLIGDGDNDSAFKTQYSAVSRQDSIHIKWLSRGGFAAILKIL